MRFPIQNDRIGCPTGPELIAEIHIFIGHVVAQVAWRQFIHAEVLRGEIFARCHDVPAESPFADMVRCCAQAREHERRIGHGRHRSNDAKMGRIGADEGCKWHRIMFGCHDRVFQIGFLAMRIAI